MPVHHVTRGDRHYYKWGDHGHEYEFDPRNPRSQKEAYDKATAQGRAAYAHGYKGHH